MALSKLTFNPGINRDTTDYSNTGGWYDCDKMRFRNGLPEKIGGWQRFIPQSFMGSCRDLMRWSSLNGTIYTAVATNLKVYVNGGSLGGLQDITPIRDTASLTNPFTTTSGSKIVKVTDAGHGCSPGDYVTFSGASTVGGVPAAELNAEFSVVEVLGTSEYTISVTTLASSSATGGGSVTAIYQVNVGLDSLVVGTGWGAGPFGGANNPFSTTVLGTDPIATNTASNTSSPYARTTLTITHSSHGLDTGDSVFLSGATTVGGVELKFINRAFDITKTGANTYTVYAWTNATSSVSGGGSLITVTAYQQSTASGWGETATSSTLNLQLRLWSLDNYGENLLLNPRDGGIYYWVENTPAARAVNLSSLPNAAYVPQAASKVIVSEIGKHVLAFGAAPFDNLTVQDKMLIRFSSDERPEYWDETDTTENAGSIRLSNGSFIMTAEQTRQEVLVWTDAALYSLQYQGAPYIFVSTLLSTSIDIIGPNATATAVNTTFWMGSDNFYYYDGTVNRMPCTVREKIFPNLNFEQRYKVFASVNSALNEVVWFYPSASQDEQGNVNTENDSYVIYNYAEKIWYYGTLPRTAWTDRGFGSNPIAASDDGYLYYHEVGSDDGSTNPPSPISAFITSSPVEIEDGGNLAFVTRIIPDITFRTTPGSSPGTVEFTLYPQNYPGGMPPFDATTGLPTSYYGTADANTVSYSYTFGTFTQQVFTRIRGRSVILKVSSDDLGVAWRLGTPRLDIRTDGRR